MSFLDLFKPAPHAQQIEGEDLIKKNYKYWRFRIFYGMYIGYVFYYFTRKSFTFAMPSMMTDLGFDKADLGILASVMAVTYGISKFLSGVLSDRSNPRYFMGIGLILTGVLNIFFGMSSSIALFAIFWGLNGWFQGWGWPPCARLLTHWYSQNERGTWWGFWNTSHSVGGALIPIIAAVCAQYLGWRYAMYLPGAFCILIGFFVLNRLRDTPQSLGLPSIEKYRNDFPLEVPTVEKENELSMKQILFRHVLNNKYIWILAISYFFVYIIRMAIFDWTVLYLVETKNYSMIGAGACVCWYEIGGIFGSLAAGWASDKIFGGKRVPIVILFSIAVILAIGGLWASPGRMFMDSLLLFVIGFFIFGPQMLIGMAPAELSTKKAAGASTGFVGLFAYLGAAIAGYPLGKMTQEYGWQGFFIGIALCGLISVMLLLPLWSIKSNPKLAKEKEPNEEALETS
ncbi:MAG TPA: MFS transporter family glucose-6-phosphate receptor UhpC [Rhabdochlamydiaceae bacterium]|nr:MFS transporter family glucose-6-phosphate receptor UhpC [Rhabdochlamydiaceae bacterium]